MSETIRNLEPKEIWTFFDQLNAVPRPSKKEEKVIRFMLNFGQGLGLDTQRDAIGNVLIRKPASKGMEHRKTVVLQAHLDMVHQKNNATDFDFEHEGINMMVDGDWVRAKGTTLGADNGLGVAAIMAVLASDTMRHPPIEALFTIDEETGMTGAKELSPDLLKGSVLLNLDTEEDDEFDVGCAGGVDVTISGTYTPVGTPENKKALKIEVKGLQGGHSGMDIHRKLGNANKIMARLLYRLSEEYPLALGSFDGGSLRNAIPREAVVLIILEAPKMNEARKFLEELTRTIKDEFRAEEDGLTINMEEHPLPETTMNENDTLVLVRTLHVLYNGVYAMSTAFPGQTETSNNVARVNATKGEIHIGCLTRSSVEAAKTHLSHILKATAELAGYSVKFSGEYPGWQPNPDSDILQVMQKRYETLFGKKAHVMAGHGGLECGIIAKKYPKMDIISFGPTILGAHSPDERASISSTQKFWKLLQDVLAHFPD